MRKITYILLIILLYITVSPLSAQYLQLSKTIPELTEANPQTASLGRYGDVPMDLYRGTANINVPLYTLNFDGLEVPINLTYNTSAIRTRQEATWVGLGWNLSSEPVIVRSINGLCDISKTDYVRGQTGFVYTDLKLPEYGGIPDVYLPVAPLNSQTSDLYERIRYYYSPDVSTSGWDTEPDIFTLNVFGQSVSFTLTQKALNNGIIGVKMINNDKRYKVEYIEEDQTFKVTNDRGYRFIFSVKETSVVAPENTNGFYVSQIFPNKIITGWKLSKIISPREKILTFNYSQPSVIQSAEQYSQSKREMLCGQIWAFNIPNPQPVPYLTGYGVYYLESIVSDNVSVEFKGSDRLDIQRDGVGSIHTTNIGSNIGVENKINPKKLDSIIIKNSLGEVTHTYNMAYSYFNNDKITEVKDNYLSNKVRLKLDQIDFNGFIYRKFDYINPNKLPDKTTLVSDFWGFQSSKVSPQGFYFPTYRDINNWCGTGTDPNGTYIQGGDRSSDPSAVRNGLLSTVTYPTGGYTELIYEPNTIKIDKDNIQKFADYNLINQEKLASIEAIDSTGVWSDVFDINNEAGAKVTLHITFAMGGMYDIPAGYDYGYSNIKFSIEEKDKNTTSYRIVNVDTGITVLTGNFTTGQVYDSQALKPDEQYNNWNKINRYANLGKGKYRIEAIGLRHISNLFAENEGSRPGEKDYMKIYRCCVKVEASVPALTNVSVTATQAGGVRIKSIENHDIENTLLTKKQYKYILDSKNEKQEPVSSGILLDELAFVNVRNHITHQIKIYESGNLDIFEDKLVRELSYESSLRSPFSNPIGYSRVEELFIDNKQEENNSGKIVSEFINKPNQYGYVSRGGNFIISYIFRDLAATTLRGDEYAKVPLVSYQDINGKVSKEEYYDNANKLIKKSDYKYDYTYYDTQNISHPKAIATGLLQYQKANYEGVDYMEQPSSFMHALQVYKIISEDISLLSRQDTEYVDGVEVTKETVYEYNDRFQPKKITENSSQSATDITTEILYPTDLSTVEQTPLLEQLVKDNIIFEPVSSKTKVGTDQVVNSHVKYKETQINYKDQAQNLTKNLVVPNIKYERSSGEIVLGSDDADNRTIKYDKYNSEGKLVQFTALEQAPVVYLWGYSGQYVIAKIQNATYDQVKSALGSTTPEDLSAEKQPNMSLVNDLREKLPYALVTTYTYYPLIGMKTATDPKGTVTKYDYDFENRLKSVYLAENGRDNLINRYQYELPAYKTDYTPTPVNPEPEDPEEPIDPNPEPTLTPDPYKKGKASSVLINIGAKGDGSYGLTGWNYDTQKVELNNVITKTYKTIEAGEYIWTTENLRLKYGTYGSINMNWVNLTQADVDKFANEYLNGQKIPLEEFEQVFGTWVTLYDVAMMYRNIYWGVPTGVNTFDHTWGLPTKEDIWQMYGQAPRTSGNVYEDIKDFLFASACDNKFGWTQNMFNRRNISGLTLTPLGMRESNQGGAIYGFGQVASLQTATWAGIETLSDRDLSGQGGIISNPYSYHFTQARHRRPMTDQELGYKMYIDAASDQIQMLPYNQASSLPELAKGLERGIALRYANREHMKVLKKWSEIQAEATEIKSKLAPTNYPAPPVLLPCEKEPEPEITADPYTKGKESTVLINIGAKGDGSYGLTGWNYDTKKVELNNVITKTYKTIEASEYIWTTENLRLKYGTYASINMNWVNLTQSDVDKYSADYLGSKSIPLDEFEQVYGTWATLYDVAMMYRNIYWGVPTGVNTFDHTWGIPNKEDIWQMYGQAPRISDNLYNDIKDFLFASSSDFNFGWTQGLFKNKNTSGLTLTPLGMRESNQGGAIYGFGQVTSLQTSTWAAIETLSDRDLSGKSGLISNPYSYHFTQARHRRPLTDQELGYKMYIDAANDQVLMLPYDQVSTLPELPKGLERGVALRYANRKAMKVVKKWSEIQAEASEIKSTITK